jgi:Fic family protein
MLTWNVHFDVQLNLADVELQRTLARAQALADVIREIPLPPKVQRRLDRLDVFSSSEADAIAGDVPTEQADARRDEERQARNAHEVRRFICRTLDEDPGHPVTEELIQELHRRMLVGLDDAALRPGVYRDRPAEVGDYVPPAPSEVPRLMADLVDWLGEQTLDAVVQAVLGHFFLVSIHPFLDGAGRVATAVESFLLYRRAGEGGGVNARGFYSLANFYNRRRREYLRLLNAVRADPENDVTPFVLFAARGLVEELEGVRDEVLRHVRVIAYRDYVRGHLSRHAKLRAGSRARLQRFVLSLLDLQVHAGRRAVPLKELRQGEGLLAALYAEKSPGVLKRDLRFLRAEKLITIENDGVRANLELMREFTA